MARWVDKPYTVLATCTAKVRDPEKIFTGWPRQPFSCPANVPSAYVIAVRASTGAVRWVLMARSRPRVGATVQLSTSPHNDTPLGYASLTFLREAANVSNLRHAPDFDPEG